MYWQVKHVEPLEDYCLGLIFADGTKKVFDMKPYLDRGIFRELRELELFRAVHIRSSSIAWPNDADFDPEALYEGGLPLAD